MSDPTAIEIEPGAPKEVISDIDVGSDLPYIVEVSDAPVRFAHKKRQAERGATLSAGQTHTLSNFRGSGIWLAAPQDTATVRVRPAGANLESQPQKDVSIIGDVQAQLDEPVDVSKSPIEIGNIVDVAGSVDVSNIDEPHPRRIEALENHDSLTSFSVSPDQSMPSNQVPNGVDVVLQADSNNLDPIYVGQIELAPGSVLTLAVSNTNVIDTSGAPGDQINVLFEGGA